MLTIMGRPSGNTTYLSLGINVNSMGFSCDAMADAVGAIVSVPSTINVAQYLPQLRLPDGAQTMPPTVGLMANSGSGGNRVANTSIAVETALSAQDLVDHFEQELQAQGWSYDSGWSGRFSSGSGWTARPTNDLELVGLLDVVSLGRSGYQASFRASSLEQE